MSKWKCVCGAISPSVADRCHNCGVTHEHITIVSDTTVTAPLVKAMSGSNLTKREVFTLAALQWVAQNIQLHRSFESAAKDAVKLADTLIEELSKEGGSK